MAGATAVPAGTEAATTTTTMTTTTTGIGTTTAPTTVMNGIVRWDSSYSYFPPLSRRSESREEAGEPPKNQLLLPNPFPSTISPPLSSSPPFICKLPSIANTDPLSQTKTEYTRTWSGGVYTVTGCEWNGNVWAGGPGGFGRGGSGGSPWGPWGKGWTWTTVTQTVTRVVTVTDAAGAPALSTSVGLAAVAQAVSGDVTSTSVIGDAETAGGGGAAATATGGSVPGDNAAAGGLGEALGVKVMAAVLGAVVAVAAWL